MRVAAIQLDSTNEKERNLDVAGKLVDKAAADGAELVALPEAFSVRGSPEQIGEAAEPLDGPTIHWARAAARDRGIWLVAGSIPERVEGHSLPFNTSCLVDRDGEIRAVYRKIHLFESRVAGAEANESTTSRAGDRIVLAEAAGVRLGMTTCYDLRFPELYRILALAGARVVTAVSAFTERTGRDHWEVLVRARAIENQVFLVAPNQIGGSNPPRYGRSMIVDPWGLVLALAPDRECYVVCDLDLAAQDAIRERLPGLAHRRPANYDWSVDGRR
jgi:predicted amidohydrolase